MCVFSSLEPVNRATAAREFRVFNAALHSLNSAYRDSVSRRQTYTHTHMNIHISPHGDTHLPPSLPYFNGLPATVYGTSLSIHALFSIQINSDQRCESTLPLQFNSIRIQLKRTIILDAS